MLSQKRCFTICSVSFALFFMFAVAAQAATVTFSTSDSPFTPNVPNHGWWSDTASNSDGNISYAVGEDRRPSFEKTIRNFFTFDLSSLIDIAVSARLELVRGTYSSTDASETLELFDVTTDPAVLNYNSGASSTIFNDLGTGTSYGAFVVEQYATSAIETLDLQLNSAALADINSSKGGFFSIGGALTTIDNSDELELLFTQWPRTVELVVETVVPEPTTICLFGLGSLLVHKRRKK